MKSQNLPLYVAAAFLAVSGLAAQPEHLDVPTLNDAFRKLADSEAREELVTPFGWNDGENRVFQRGGWKFAFNDREVTQIRTPKGSDVNQFADFLWKEPWSKRLSPRLREGAELSPGERKAIRIVYLAWIDSLKGLASLGYQHVSFHACVNSRAFLQAQGRKNVSFGDGSIYGTLLQNYFDRERGVEERVSAIPVWGAGFVEPRNSRLELLKRIVHGGNEKLVSAMRPRQLNEYFFVAPRVSDFDRELKVDGGTGTSQIASWRRIADEVRSQIGTLASIKNDIEAWREAFEATSLPEKDAAELEDEMARIAAELNAANEDAVRRARIVFFDYPLSRACLAFKREIAGSTSWTYSRETELENLRRAARSFRSDIGGETMLANIKAAYAANEYAAAMGAFKKTAGKSAFRLLQETGVRELGSETMGRIAEGLDPWSPNDIPDPYANLDQFRREILADASNALRRARSAKTTAAKALVGLDSARKSAKDAGGKASEVLAEADDTLQSELDIPSAKKKAGEAKRLAEKAAAEASTANRFLDDAVRGNERVKSLSEDVDNERSEAMLNASESPDVARKAATDARERAREAEEAAVKCGECVKTAGRHAEAAIGLASKAEKWAAEASKERRAEERRVADEKRDVALSAKEQARSAEKVAKRAQTIAASARQTALKALSDCDPTDRSHLDIPEIQALAREARAAAEAALDSAGRAESAARESLEFVSGADSNGSEALQKSALVHSNETARVIRAALSSAIGSATAATNRSERAVKRATDAGALAERARTQAAEAKRKADRSGADRREEEKRVATEKRNLAKGAAAQNDASSAALAAARERSSGAVEKASTAKRACVPTLETHLGIPETVELARTADKAGDEAIAAAKSAGRNADESDALIRKSRAKIDVSLEQAAIALDDSRSPDAVREALDRAIAATVDATGFARDGKEAAANAEKLSVEAESKAASAEETSARATAGRKAAEKEKAEELRNLAEETISRNGKTKEELGKAREELLDARKRALYAQERCVATKDSRLPVSEIKRQADEAVKAGDAALKSAKIAEANASDAEKKVSESNVKAEAALGQCRIALDEERSPDEVRDAIDKAISFVEKAQALSEEAGSFSAKAKESSATAAARAAEADRGASDSTEKRIAEEKRTAEEKKAEAEAAIEKAKEAVAAASAAVERAGAAAESVRGARPDIEARLKDKTLSDEERKAAKEAARAADAAERAAKDAVSAEKDVKSAAEKAKTYAETAISGAATAVGPEEAPKAIRDALDKAIRSAKDASEKAEDARKYAEKAAAAATRAEEAAKVATAP